MHFWDKHISQGAKIAAVGISLMFCGVVSARTIEFKHDKKSTESEGKNRIFTDKTKSQRFEIRVGSPTAKDSLDEIEIRAGTVMKNIVTKKYSVNDISKLKFKPDNKTSIRFSVESGAAKFTEDNWKDVGSDYSRGYTIGGVIIELWQNGKCLKHWASYVGAMAKTALDENVKLAYLSKDGYETEPEYFKNKTIIRQVTTAERVAKLDSQVKLGLSSVQKWSDVYRKDPKSLLDEQVHISHAKNNEIVYLQCNGEFMSDDICTPEYMLDFYRAKKIRSVANSNDADAIKKMADVVINDMMLNQELYQKQEKLLELIKENSSSDPLFTANRQKIKRLSDRIYEIKNMRMKTWNRDGSDIK